MYEFLDPRYIYEFGEWFDYEQSSSGEFVRQEKPGLQMRSY